MRGSLVSEGVSAAKGPAVWQKMSGGAACPTGRLRAVDVQRFEVLLADQHLLAQVGAREIAEAEETQEAAHMGGRDAEVGGRLLDRQVLGIRVELRQCHLRWRGLDQRKVRELRCQITALIGFWRTTHTGTVPTRAGALWAIAWRPRVLRLKVRRPVLLAEIPPEVGITD